MRDSRTASRKIALCAMLMALAMIFSYVEVLIPINLGAATDSVGRLITVEREQLYREVFGKNVELVL